MNIVVGIFLIICSILVAAAVSKLLGVETEKAMTFKQGTIFVIVNVAWNSFALFLFFNHREAVEEFIFWAVGFIIAISKFIK